MTRYQISALESEAILDRSEMRLLVDIHRKISVTESIKAEDYTI